MLLVYADVFPGASVAGARVSGDKNDDAILAFYPAAAKAAAVNGSAVLSSLYDKHRAPSHCILVRKTPAEQSFDEAALRIAEQAPGVQKMNFPVSTTPSGLILAFNASPLSITPDLLLPPHIVVAPRALTVPTDEDLASFYPAKGRRKGVEGAVKLVCKVVKTGELTACEVQSEEAEGMGFGAEPLRCGMAPRLAASQLTWEFYFARRGILLRHKWGDLNRH